MTRSLKKGPFVDPNVAKKVLKAKEEKSTTPIKTYSRPTTIVPDFVGLWFEVHNGKDFIKFLVTEDMVGHKLGEFSPTTKFRGHGGKNAK